MSSGGGQQTSTTKVQYSPTEQAARDNIAQGASGLFNQLWQTPANNEAIAKPVGPSQYTNTGLQWDNWAVKNMEGNTQQAQTNNNWAAQRGGAYSSQPQQSEINSSNSQLLRATDVTRNPALAGAIEAAQRPLIQQFMNAGGPMSAIRNNAVDNGAFGGSRQGIAEGLAVQGLQKNLGDVSSTMMSKAYDSGLNAQVSATNNMMNAQHAAERNTLDSVKNQAMLNMMYSQPGQIMAENGAQMEGYQQAQNNYNAEVAGNWENSRYKQLQNFANIVYGGSNGTTQTTQSAPKTDHTGQILGTAGTMAMMYMMM